MQMYKGLMRYHSAPSSVLAGLLNEDTQPQLSNAFLQVEDSEFARFLDDHLCNMVNPHESGPKPLPSADFHSTAPFTSEKATSACLADSKIRSQSLIQHKSSAFQQPLCMANAGCSKSLKDVLRGPLSSISELCADESNQHSSFDAQMKISSASQYCPKPPKTPISNKGGMAHEKSQLARHNSSPADVLSRLIMDEGDIGESVLHFGGPSTQKLGKGQSCMLNHVSATSLSPIDRVNCLSDTEDGKGVFVDAKSIKPPADERKSSLLRQNSSPAGVLSQISFGGISSLTCTKLKSSPLSENYASEEERRGGVYEAAARCWGEIGFDKAGLEHRKRGREDHGLQSSEISFTNQKESHVGSHGKMYGNGLVKMEALCRISAKRGCATHPRSIAERVRRTKINEGIRKLQELMPNMEKQTNTVTMLDEAVEYVKLLQRQVQELSESRPKCDGRCNLKLGGSNA